MVTLQGSFPLRRPLPAEFLVGSVVACVRVVQRRGAPGTQDMKQAGSQARREDLARATGRAWGQVRSLQRRRRAGGPGRGAGAHLGDFHAGSWEDAIAD